MEVVAVFQNLSNNEVSTVINEWLATCLATTAYHPLLYSRTLFMIGYEPFLPEERILFGWKWLMLPNTLQNLSYIKSVDGISGLYRGLLPTLFAKTVFLVTNRLLKDLIPKPKPGKEDIKVFNTLAGPKSRVASLNFHFKGTLREFLFYIGGIIASHPFRVVAVRMMAQFVGRETKFTSTCESLMSIYRSEGLSGLFIGIVPALLGAFISFWSFTLLVMIGQWMKLKTKGCAFTMYSDVAKGVAFWLAHPLEVVSYTVIVNNCGLEVGVYPHANIYPDWTAAFQDLQACGQLFRGARNFGRVYSGPFTKNDRLNGCCTHFGPAHLPSIRQSGVMSYKPSEKLLKWILPARLISRECE